jgi:hypothetical protein
LVVTELDAAGHSATEFDAAADGELNLASGRLDASVKNSIWS